MEYVLDYDNMSKEGLISINKALFREIDYYKKILDENNIRY